MRREWMMANTRSNTSTAAEIGYAPTATTSTSASLAFDLITTRAGHPPGVRCATNALKIDTLWQHAEVLSK